LKPIGARRHFGRAKGFEMAGEELRIEQGETADAQPRH
jgi:hypothetical protein